MAYRDPYRDPYAAQYVQTQNEQKQYVDSTPYPSSHQPQPSYDQASTNQDHGSYGGYRDEPAPSQRTLAPSISDQTVVQESRFSHDFAAPALPRQEKTARAMRRYRQELQGNLWTKGGRGRCICRFCCCSILVTLLLIISIALSMALWIRPPSIDIGSVAPRGSGNPTQVSLSGMNVSLGVDISVSNPNYFSVAFNNIEAEISYPINHTRIGRGIQRDIVFPANAKTSFTFPFMISYQTASDAGSRILIDLATRCGVIGNTKSPITVEYKITLGLRIFFITVSPVVANTFSFDCPVAPDDLRKLLDAAGIPVG